MDQVPKDLFDLHFVMSIDENHSDNHAEDLYSVQANAEDQRQQLELLAQQQQSPIKIEDIPDDFVIDHEEILTEIGVPKVLPMDCALGYNSGAAVSRVENCVGQPKLPEQFASLWKLENLTPPSTPDNIKVEDDGVQDISGLSPMSMVSVPYFQDGMPQEVPVGYMLVPLHFGQNMFLPQYQQYGTPSTTYQDVNRGAYWQTHTVPTPDPSPSETPTPTASPLISPIIPELITPVAEPSISEACGPVTDQRYVTQSTTHQDFHQGDWLKIQTIPTPDPSPTETKTPITSPLVSPIIPEKVKPAKAPCTSAVCGSDLPTTIPQNRDIPKRKRKPLKARVHYDTGFYCAPCDRTFGRPGSFTQHNKVKHSGPRDHKCDICGKRYKLYEEMKEHEQRHLVATKDYACSACTKQFHHQKDLDRHYGLHHGLAPFSCKECGKGFGRADHLTAHMISHKNNTIKAPRQKSVVVFVS